MVWRDGEGSAPQLASVQVTMIGETGGEMVVQAVPGKTLLEATLAAERWGRKANVTELANLWTASRDTRNYMVVGDPAVRLTPMPVKEQPPAPVVYRGGSR